MTSLIVNTPDEWTYTSLQRTLFPCPISSHFFPLYFRPYLFSPPHLSSSTLRSMSAGITTCQYLMYSVFRHLSRHLVSGHILFHQVSPSQLWFASISLSIYCIVKYISRGLIFISPVHMSYPNHLDLFSLRNYAIGFMCASFQMSTFLTWSSIVFPLAHSNMLVSVVCNSLSSRGKLEFDPDI